MKGWILALAGLLATVVLGCASAPPGPAGGLARGVPEEQGVSSAAILAFLEAADAIDALHSVMIVRHGTVVAEGWWAPWEAGSPHELYSLSKSFTSTAVGLAVAEGRLSIDDPVLKFFPDDAPPDPSDNLRAMRVRDLLTMSAGHQDETSSAPDRITAKSFLAHPVPHQPGTRFKYNTPATFMQSAIVQKVTGQTVLEYLRPRLFEPLGIESPVWKTSAQGISLGGYGLSVRTKDIARFGQLYLQRGRWQGKQLIPESWIDLATSRQVPNGSNPKSDWNQGYGFQFWRCRHGAYRGDGAFGQYCIVLPEQDAVIAITSGLKDMQAVLNLVWDRLLPGFQTGALPADPAGAARLRERLAGLRVRAVEGGETSPVASKIGGKRFVFPANDQKLEWIALRPASGGKRTEVSLRVDGADRAIACGHREWVKGPGAFDAYAGAPAAASGAWTADDTFVVKQCLTETPFVLTMTLRFAGAEVTCAREMNVGFGPTKKPALTGRAE
jgi:CubicO group peptidase (beta-lactamase class C family)